MLRQRSPQNRNDRKGMKNRGRGLCKKANDYYQLFGEDILVLLKAPNNKYQIGFQSKPGLFEAFCSAPIPKNILRGPESFKTATSPRSMPTARSSLSRTDSSTIGTTPASRASSDYSAARDTGLPESLEPRQSESLGTTSRPLSKAPPSTIARLKTGSKLPRGLATQRSQAKLAALIEACFD